MRLNATALFCLLVTPTLASAAALPGTDSLRFDDRGQPTLQVRTSNLAPLAPYAKVDAPLDGTWDGAIVYNDGTTYEFMTEMAMYPPIEGSVFPSALAVRMTVGGQSLYTGTFAFQSTLFLYVVTHEHGFFSVMTLQPDGKFAGTSTDANDKSVQMVLKPRNTTQPFHFSSVVMTENVAPQVIDDLTFFGSPQTAVTKIAVARVDGEPVALIDYSLLHNVKNVGGTGVAGVLDLTLAIAEPQRFAPVIRSTLDGKNPPNLGFNWAKSAQVVSATPFVARFDNDDLQIHATVSEPEN